MFFFTPSTSHIRSAINALLRDSLDIYTMLFALNRDQKPSDGSCLKNIRVPFTLGKPAKYTAILPALSSGLDRWRGWLDKSEGSQLILGGLWLKGDPAEEQDSDISVVGCESTLTHSQREVVPLADAASSGEK